MIIRFNEDLNCNFLSGTYVAKNRNVVLDCGDHRMRDVSFLVDSPGNVTIKNLSATIVENPGIKILNGNVSLENCHWFAHNTESDSDRTVGEDRGRFLVLSGSWTRKNIVHIDKDCTFDMVQDYDYTGTMIHIWGCPVENLPGWKTEYETDWEKMNSIVSKYRPTLYFDGTMRYRYEGTERTGSPYGIYTYGGQRYTGPEIYINDHANIDLRCSDNSVGIHFVSDGTLYLNGGRIYAPTGITARGARIIADYSSTIEVEAYGNDVDTIYVPAPSTGKTKSYMLYGNALMVEAYPAGYGSICNVYKNTVGGYGIADYQINGGTFTSAHNYAIGSYSHPIGTTTSYYPRLENFVDPDVELNSGRTSTGPYDYSNGNNADWHIRK